MDVEKKKHWFRAKRFGYGWYPYTWQAWLIILGYIAAIIFFGLRIENLAEDKLLEQFFYPVIFLTIVLVYISWKKGEKASFRWNGKEVFKKKDSE